MQNEISAIKKVPILGGKEKRKQDEFDRVKKLILDNPESFNRIKLLAEDLNKHFNASTQIATNIRIGAIFQDTLTGKRVAYEHFVIPYKHDAKTLVIIEMAGKKLEEYQTDYQMVFYDPDSNPSPRYLMSALDFCIYLACKVWVIIDPNHMQEKDFLESIR